MSDMDPKHFLTGNELKNDDINKLISMSINIKKGNFSCSNMLSGKQIALSFEKPSLRTRLSFSAAISKMGGTAIESCSDNRKQEHPKDFIQVVQNYCDAIMIRTYDDQVLNEMKLYSKIPIINGLSNQFHPCQTLADLMTIKECVNTFSNVHIAYIGDGNNVLNSLLIMATKLGITVHYCCPRGHGPSNSIIDMIEDSDRVRSFENPVDAVNDCHAVYTDVWTSMGFEEKNTSLFMPYQVNQLLMSYAKKNAFFMHCMPMNRGLEVSEDMPDDPCSVIYQQSENRLYVQQALLINLLKEG